MVIKMKISWLKCKNDKSSFRLPETLGFDVFYLSNLEQTDKKLAELINEKYDTIVISNEVAGFSEDIIKKYQKNKNIRIVISFDKDK